MMAEQRHRKTWLSRLARDVRGNTLAITAAAMVPLCGMIGGAVDGARLYLTKARLQHACDAGTLAGRKAMGGGQWSQNSGQPNTIARQFFAGNFVNGAYGSTGLSYAFSESAGKVTGTATVTVPMTLMKVLAVPDQTITVTCDAEMRLPNTDVMFVLDTTGSMGTNDAGGGQTRIAALKVAVKCFYEIVARLDTDANCATGTPSGGTSSQVQIRFGFVPYATNVNVGRLLRNDWMADSWTYQTRTANYWPVGTTTTSEWEEYTANPSILSTECQSFMRNQAFTGFTPTPATYTVPGATFTVSFNSSAVPDSNSWGWSTAPDNGGSYRSCRRWRTVTVNATQRIFRSWTYGPGTINVSGLKAGGSNWNNSVQVPVGANGTNITADWDGCVEERATVTASSYNPRPSGALDLDIGAVPVAGQVDTQWKPVLPDVIYSRTLAGWQTASETTNFTYNQDAYYACPKPATKLQAWPNASAFSTYVDSLTPEGNTYHDIGLLWGARLMWPTGIFGAENALTPQGGEIERHLIFMTDGDPCTGIDNYTAYGFSWFDRRTTDPSVGPTDGCTTTGTLTQQVNARTDAICTAIKNQNITLWVITFGSVANNTTQRMTACATSGRYFNATNATTLQQTFASIANQISQLRLTR